MFVKINKLYPKLANKAVLFDFSTYNLFTY